MSKNLKVHLLIIDPQNDFMGNDDGTPYGITLTDGTTLTASLPVKGGVSDMKRVAALLKRIGPRLDDVHVTLDSHRVIDVAHPGFWKDAAGKSPSAFTLIRQADILSGLWEPRAPSQRKRMLDYTGSLEARGKYLLLIWPEHCLIGTWGHNILPDLMKALTEWERRELANVDYVVKGSNPFTEHYGGLMAEVPDPDDPTTQLNMDLIKILQSADIVAIAGEASSHCVRETVTQIADNIGDDHLTKIHLLINAMSPVPAAPGTPDFPAIAQQFLDDMKIRGMALSKAEEFLA